MPQQLVGYPTPNEFELSYTCRRVYIPNEPEFIALIPGLLIQATREYFWTQVGSMTPETAAQYMRLAIGKYVADEECGELSCEQIIECIQTDTDVRNALIQFLTDAGYGTGVGTPDLPSNYNSNPLLLDGSEIEDCNNDNLYGAIVQLIDFINKRLIDFFEVIESETNAFERAAIIGEGIPITDSIGVDTVANTFDQLIEEIAENYDANMTEELQQEYECDLFCLVKDTCELDMQTFADYFMGRISGSINQESFEDLVAFFNTGSWTGTQLVDAAFAVVVSALAYASSVVGISVSSIASNMIAALNDPSSDWETLCDDCPPDVPTPEIGLADCAGFAPALGTLTYMGGNTWRLEGVVNGSTDRRAMIVRQGGGSFRMEGTTAIVGTIPAFRVWKQTGGSCSAGFSGPNPQTTAMDMYGFTASVGSAFTLEFDFVEP